MEGMFCYDLMFPILDVLRVQGKILIASFCTISKLFLIPYTARSVVCGNL